MRQAQTLKELTHQFNHLRPQTKYGHPLERSFKWGGCGRLETMRPGLGFQQLLNIVAVLIILLVVVVKFHLALNDNLIHDFL